MDAPALEAARKLPEQQLSELKTQQNAQQPLSKRLESAIGALQRAQMRAEETEVAFTLALTVKEQADQEAAIIQSELCTLEQEAHKSSYRSYRRTPTRPLLGHHRQHHCCTAQSWSACRALGAGPTRSLHTHQRLPRAMYSCGSGDGCRRARRPDDGLRWLGRGIPTDAIESVARRRNRQVGKKTIDLLTFASKERTLNSHQTWRLSARSTHNAVRVTHTERLVHAIVNVKTHKPKERSRSHKYGVDTNNTIDQIDWDMSLHGCHVVGVQESCIKVNVTREQQNFVAYTSGANGKGQLGVEAWVHRSVLKRARVRPEPCSPVCWSSRLIARKST